MKICRVGAELFHADRRMDGWTDRHDEANISFRNFANAPNKATASVHTVYSVLGQNCISYAGL